jgi:glycosyltransferase involved in cell wall biosynthesis
MKQFIDVIVPQFYGENKAKPLFHSLNNQIGIDFSLINIIVVNDCGGKKLSKTFFSEFSNLKNIQYLTTEKKSGPGPARQLGIDHATGFYVMFVDEDDYLLSNFIFQCVKEMLNYEGRNIYHTYVYDSNSNLMQPTTILLHGKIFKRSFLVENNIRFHPEIRINEDNYFNLLAEACTEKKVVLPIGGYVWVNNPDSLTRKNSSDFRIKSYQSFFFCMLKLAGEFEQRGFHDQLCKIVCLATWKAYYYNSLDFSDEYQDEKLIALLTFSQFYKAYENYLSDASIAVFKETKELCYKEAVFQGLIFEKTNFDTFIKNIKELIS